MTLFAVIIFALSCIGIIGLFVLKQWELKREQLLVPSLRDKADAQALKFKELLTHSKTHLERIPPAMVRYTSLLVHKGALGFARGARVAERQAYRLADVVSHKHRFERRETQSEFLKKMSEIKIAEENTIERGGLE